MSDQIVEPEVKPEVDVDENEPVFFKVKTLNLVASAARILSWVVLVCFVGIFVGNIMSFIEMAQGAQLAEIFKQVQGRLWIFNYLVIPFCTGATFFVLLQGVSNIIDALLEVDFNTREAK
ncbi:MAG: hypothetical protein GYA15_08275 [Leptolinea sp.]|jgi:hypothetical protein|nr:hypothetical protein [Leptolinea sp.]